MAKPTQGKRSFLWMIEAAVAVKIIGFLQGAFGRTQCTVLGGV
ncbi:hypothetical protein [Clostridium sp. MCC345]